MRPLPFICVLVFALAAAPPAFAQIDLSGSWQAVFHEDQPERVPGPALGDYLGLPVNDNARAFAESWDPSRLTVPEHQTVLTERFMRPAMC